MSPGEAPKSIAVLRMSALGDVVMTLPLLRTLLKAFPRTKIHWIVSRPFDTIVRGVSGIELIVIDKPRGPFSFWRLWRQLRAYDFIIWQGDKIIAGSDAASIRNQWVGGGWGAKLRSIIYAASSRFDGPLQSPNEPWHYTYIR